MGTRSFAVQQGGRVLERLVRVIQDNRQLLSDIDGAIGDGDHGVNMAKGFALAGEELARNPGGLDHGLKTLSRTLMSSIGGAMGPLYGMLFRGLAKGAEGRERVDAAVFGGMLQAAESSLRAVSQAQVGDKTLIDAFIPAARAYAQALERGEEFAACLEAMSLAAERGRDSTRDLVARVGRASRLGERSRGTLDAGATSCALLLRTMGEAIRELLAGGAEGADASNTIERKGDGV